MRERGHRIMGYGDRMAEITEQLVEETVARLLEAHGGPMPFTDLWMQIIIDQDLKTAREMNRWRHLLDKLNDGQHLYRIDHSPLIVPNRIE